MSRAPGCLYLKDPDSIEPYGFDWTDWLAEIGASETVSTSTWASSPSGLTLTSGAIVTGSKKTQITVAGGTSGTYVVTNSIVTSSGYEDDRSFYVLVQDR
jgi:hypothetical protein